jgi:regulator of RNase E activity RraA
MEEKMGRDFRSIKIRHSFWWLVAVLPVVAIGLLFASERSGSAQPPAAQDNGAPAAQTAPASNSPADLLSGFRHVEVASVSDAEEQILGKKMYMSHRMRPLFPTKFAGFALTVELKHQENSQGAAALGGMLAAIDNGAPDSVYVMVVQDGADIAGMGGEMGTTMAARGFAGAVVDGGVRDSAYLEQIKFPVYGTGIVPSTSVNHYVFAGSNIPVVCDGVAVSPGDVIVADSDGVVAVPRARAAEVLAMAQNMDFAEHSIDAYIMKYKSIEEAVKKFGRI